MLAERRKHLPANVTAVQAAFEDLPLDASYDLVYSAAALHWTNPEGRWARMAALVRPGGVFAVIERRLTMSAHDYVGHLSTVSAYVMLPPADRDEVFRRILHVLPGTVEIDAEVTVHLARRRS